MADAISCTKCDGEGLLRFPTGAEKICDVCGGTGKLEDTAPKFVYQKGQYKAGTNILTKEGSFTVDDNLDLVSNIKE